MRGMMNFSNSQYIHFCNNSVFFLESVRVSLADFFFEPFSQVTSLTYPQCICIVLQKEGRM